MHDNNATNLSTKHIWYILVALEGLVLDREGTTAAVPDLASDSEWEAFAASPFKYYIFSERSVRREIADLIRNSVPDIEYGQSKHGIAVPLPGPDATAGKWRELYGTIGRGISSSADCCGWEGAEISSIKVTPERELFIELTPSDTLPSTSYIEGQVEGALHA